MSAARKIIASMTLTLAIGCGPVESPSSLKELKNLSISNQAQLAKQAAPGAWEEGVKFLKLSDAACADGKSEKADRLAQLGIIQTKIAFAAALRANAEMRLEIAQKKQRELDLAATKTKSKLKEIETKLERIAIRKHLEAVVDKTRRKAAAAEEQKEDLLSKKEKRVLDRARLRLGQEILGRIDVWQSILEVFVSKGHLEANRLAILDGETTLAKESLKERDLAAVQEHVEYVGIKARRLITDAWAGNETKREELRAEISSKLKEAGFEGSRDDYALTSVVTFPSPKKLKSSKQYKDLRSVCDKIDNIQLVTHTQSTPAGTALLLIIPVP